MKEICCPYKKIETNRCTFRKSHNDRKLDICPYINHKKCPLYKLWLEKNKSFRSGLKPI